MYRIIIVIQNNVEYVILIIVINVRMRHIVSSVKMGICLSSMKRKMGMV